MIHAWLLIVLVLAIGAAILAGDRTTGRIILRKWADRNGLTLIEYRCRRLFRGPFMMDRGRVDVVFRIAARHCTGTIRQGWVRFHGLSIDRADVRWDDEPTRFGEWPIDFPGGR